MREDISANLSALEDLHRDFNTDILLIESGGDNLAANYSRELADYIIYVVSGMGRGCHGRKATEMLKSSVDRCCRR